MSTARTIFSLASDTVFNSCTFRTQQSQRPDRSPLAFLYLVSIRKRRMRHYWFPIRKLFKKHEMEPWKKILYISWGIVFFHSIGMSMISPFLPLYLKELGIADARVQSLWSGVIIGITPLFSGLMAPFWGTISDKYGRRPLILRSTFGISFFVLLMSFATDVYQLLALRILHGTCGGVLPAFTALVAFNLPEEKTGEGIGILQSAVYSGTIIGPFLGGLCSDWFGYRNVLFLISALTLIAGIATVLFIHEPKRDPAQARSTILNNLKLVLGTANLRLLVVIILAIQFSLFLVQPILPLFIVSLAGSGESATMVGLVFSVTGFSTLLFAPYWGKAGDKRGHENVLSRNLLWAGLVFLPQALVTSAFHLLPLRALLGFFIAGIVPTLQTLIVKNTKDAERGGVLGITHSVHAFGHALGPLAGGMVGAACGYRWAIALTSLLLLLFWFLFRNFMMKNERGA